MIVASAGPPQPAPIASRNRSSHSSTRAPGSRSWAASPWRDARRRVGHDRPTGADQGIGHRLGRLEVGKRSEPRTSSGRSRLRQRGSTRCRSLSPAGKPPSGWMRAADGVRFQPRRATTPTAARIGPTAAAGDGPRPRRRGREGRRSETDQGEDHRVGECVVMVVGEPGTTVARLGAVSVRNAVDQRRPRPSQRAASRSGPPARAAPDRDRDDDGAGDRAGDEAVRDQPGERPAERPAAPRSRTTGMAVSRSRPPAGQIPERGPQLRDARSSAR